MRTLLVLRHAKSPHPAGVDDHDRPLAPEARTQIARLAQLLASECLLPDVVLTSDAVRARDTAAAYSEAVSGPMPIRLPEFYDPGNAEDVLGAVRERHETERTVLVVGHNPGLQELCNRLTKRPLVEHLGTGTLAAFNAAVGSWAELRFGSAALMGLWSSH